MQFYALPMIPDEVARSSSKPANQRSSTRAFVSPSAKRRDVGGIVTCIILSVRIYYVLICVAMCCCDVVVVADQGC